MPDRYRCFAELAKSERRDRDFRILCRDRGSATVIVAPHGGGIEPGTSEVAAAIAGDDFSLYAFEGMKPRGNGRLHITSVRFDEPDCLALVENSAKVISVHGEASKRKVILLGGRDKEMLKRLCASLGQNGFCVERSEGALQGIKEANLSNRARSGAGVQLELSEGLRRSFFQSLSKEGRQKKTARFHEFAAAVREVIPQADPDTEKAAIAAGGAQKRTEWTG